MGRQWYQHIYICPVDGCGKTFRRKAYVKKHMELHSNHKAYGCDLCDVRCRQYAGLYIHYKGVHKLKLRKSNVRYYRSNDEVYTSLENAGREGMFDDTQTGLGPSDPLVDQSTLPSL